MKALKIVGIILILLIALFFVIALFLPSSLRMEESIIINKPASLVFKQVNNFRNWETWSPWQETDPGMEITYSGPDLGVGASYSWVSPIHGNGQMTIMESVPYEKIINELDFMEQEIVYTNFYFEETEEGTRVTWITEIPHLSYPVERYFGLVMPGMMKKFFSAGLENLKEAAEGMEDPVEVTLTTFPETKAVTILDSCHWQDFETTLSAMYGELMQFIESNRDLEMAGAPFTMYTKWSEEEQFAAFEAGIPVSGEAKERGRVKIKTIPASRVVTGTHYGRYEDIGAVYLALEEYVKEFSLQETCCPMEVYVTDPLMEPDTSKWRTNVYFVIQ